MSTLTTHLAEAVEKRLLMEELLEDRVAVSLSVP